MRKHPSDSAATPAIAMRVGARRVDPQVSNRPLAIHRIRAINRASPRAAEGKKSSIRAKPLGVSHALSSAATEKNAIAVFLISQVSDPEPSWLRGRDRFPGKYSGYP